MILGFSEGFHDASISLVSNTGDILFAAHSERSSRKKHDRYVSEKLKKFVADNHPSKIAFYEKPFLKKTRQFYAGQYKTVFSDRQLSFQPTHYFHHHLSHAAAAFQTSRFEEASCIVVDSIGEWDTVSIWTAHYDYNGIAKYKKVYSQRYPNSIGLWYSALTKQVGLRPLDEEYIFMGMSAYGKPTLVNELTDLLENHCLHTGIPSSYGEFLDTHDKYSIANSAQVVLESKLEEIFDIAASYSDNICYGGGVALNCVANAKFYQKHNLWIMPNPGDAGASLGAAALAYGKRLNWIDPYLGENIIRKIEPNEVVAYLRHSHMCGIANGKAEFGPRALGNRSLIADPRGSGVKDIMNIVKKREMFRPFAPAILEEHASNYFEGTPTKYMQSVVKCRFPDKFPGIVHHDGTSRVQLVGKNDNTVLRPILEAWYAKTGCPMLLNTSLNIKGQPMVDTWKDALEFQKEYIVKVF